MISVLNTVSGYDHKQRRDIITAGIRTHFNKLKTPDEKQIHCFRNMEDKQTRKISKMSEKNLWFNKVIYKKKRRTNKKYNYKKTNKSTCESPVWVDALLMVPRTPDWALCRSLRQTENILRKKCNS